MLKCPAQANGIVGAFQPDRVVWVQGHRDVVLLGLLEQAVEKPKRRLVSCGIGGGERAGGEGKIQMPLFRSFWPAGPAGDDDPPRGS